MSRPERRARLCGLLATLLVVTAPLIARSQAAPTVQTAQGQIVGQFREASGAVFLGIPFARPPVGDLRWRPPQPAEAKGRIDATASGPACLQSSFGWNAADAARSSEDCLYLDVATPDLNPKARRPVMVWIHGGANWAGSGAGTVSSGLSSRGVVVVSVQYRLGVFGFLSHPGLTAEGQGASGNYALMDLVARRFDEES